jgi:N-acetylmuramoyl-L-alanine amidase
VSAAVVAAAAAGCGASGPRAATHHPAPPRRTYTYAAAAAAAAAPTAAAPTAAAPTAAAPPAAAPPDPKPAARATTAPLAGKVIGIDPGHNGNNYTDPTFLNHLIWNGREQETCDTTGTETDGGYSEARFNFNVATYLAADLRAEGAKVVLTRTSNSGVGPCVTTRAQIINHAHANVAIDIHADGGPPGGRGFTVLEPVADGPNNRVIGASETFAHDLLQTYHTLTGMPLSTYDGVGGVAPRDDLAGLNLTTVPKVLIECGNMRNATDAALLISTSFQKLTAKAFTQAIRRYLTARG